MRDVIEANGDEHVNLNACVAPEMTFPKQKNSYCHKSIEEEEWEAEEEAQGMALREEEKEDEEEDGPVAFDDAIADAKDAAVTGMALGVDVRWWDWDMSDEDESAVGNNEDDGSGDDEIAEEEKQTTMMR